MTSYFSVQVSKGQVSVQNPKKVRMSAQLDTRTKIDIVERATFQRQIAATIKQELPLTISTKRVQQSSKTHEFIKFVKCLKIPAQINEHNK